MVSLEGSVPALPKKFQHLTTALRTLHIALKLGSPGGSPSQIPKTPNKFGAQKIRHQPLAEASSMLSQF